MEGPSLVQAPVPCVKAGGHEGSFSLMSLFVLFQSAASSDGGEYNPETLTSSNFLDASSRLLSLKWGNQAQT